MVDLLEAGTTRVLQPRTVIVSRIKTNSRVFDKSVLHEKYVLERRSMRQIAREFASSKHFVRRALIDFGIPLRGRWRNPYRKNNLPYGKKCRKCKVVVHPGEQKIIQLILKMHEEGISNSAIARVLTEMKIPTKTRLKEWHYESVRRILMAHGK